MKEKRGDKVPLVVLPHDRWGPSTTRRPTPITWLLPFFQSQSGSGRYVHRVRSANVHWGYCEDREKVRHYSFDMWCSQPHTTSKPRRVLFAEAPDTGPACATCEARALAAGYGSNALVALCPIAYRPRGMDN